MDRSSEIAQTRIERWELLTIDFSQKEKRRKEEEWRKKKNLDRDPNYMCI